MQLMINIYTILVVPWHMKRTPSIVEGFHVPPVGGHRSSENSGLTLSYTAVHGRPLIQVEALTTAHIDEYTHLAQLSLVLEILAAHRTRLPHRR